MLCNTSLKIIDRDKIKEYYKNNNSISIKLLCKDRIMMYNFYGGTMDSKELAKIFKALSNENRLEIYLEILKCNEKSFEDDECCGCFITDIINKFNIGAPTISHHLKELTNAGLIFTEKKGKYLIARINEELVNEACSMLKIDK
ncbi:putative transcriptional repressor [Clostridium neonatale]|nr:Putative transcriptional repressor [Clostridium neonatale]CAI3574335.1 putative transcriptional repressor [Clostridium neonatale]CAI3708893.1 putative transcriptional repressor [Clostridium neonatale]